MTLDQFKHSLTQRQPPADLTPALTALWWAGKDKWDTAHQLVMDEGGKDCAWVHAYLHRMEEDAENAGYWYRKAGVPMATGSFPAEWTAIARDLVSKPARKAGR